MVSDQYKNQDCASYAKSEPEDVEERVIPVFKEFPKGDGEIVVEHCWLFYNEKSGIRTKPYPAKEKKASFIFSKLVEVLQTMRHVFK